MAFVSLESGCRSGKGKENECFCCFWILFLKHLLDSAGSSLWHAGSFLVGCTLLVADHGRNPGPLLWKPGVLATGSPGKSLSLGSKQTLVTFALKIIR